MTGCTLGVGETFTRTSCRAPARCEMKTMNGSPVVFGRRFHLECRLPFRLSRIVPHGSPRISSSVSEQTSAGAAVPCRHALRAPAQRVGTQRAPSIRPRMDGENRIHAKLRNIRASLRQLGALRYSGHASALRSAISDCTSRDRTSVGTAPLRRSRLATRRQSRLRRPRRGAAASLAFGPFQDVGFV